MIYVTFGVPLLVAFMALVMGIPYAYFLKRDMRYNASARQPNDVRLNIWYNCEN